MKTPALSKFVFLRCYAQTVACESCKPTVNQGGIGEKNQRYTTLLHFVSTITQWLHLCPKWVLIFILEEILIEIKLRGFTWQQV